MKKCELCNSVANVLCESDEASLCWDCDSKVHGANFLVGKHLRVLLCHLCQAPTPWNGSGPKLLPADSFCHNCVKKSTPKTTLRRGRGRSESGGGGGSNGGSDDEMENQVVPWLALSSRPN